MSDYQRQRDETGGGGKGGWRAKLFNRQRSMGTERSVSPSVAGGGTGGQHHQSGNNSKNHKRSMSAASSAYQPPSMMTPGSPPVTPQISNVNTTTDSNIELPNMNNNNINRHRKSKSTTLSSHLQSQNRNIPDSLINNNGDDHGTIDTTSVLHAATEMERRQFQQEQQQRQTRHIHMNMVDSLTNDVIGKKHNNTNDSVLQLHAKNSFISTGTNDIETPHSMSGSIMSSSDYNTVGDGSTVMSGSITSPRLTSTRRSSSGGETSTRRQGSSSHRGTRKSRKKNKSSTNKESLEEKLDTYSGVFLPCLAQIVGVIFFLRLPTITGQAGTIGATLIILTCVFSTFITSLSLSAIASNGTIQAGGPYYIISRTLGVEIGGAVGVLFYLGTTLGASMHVMGAVETMIHRKKHAYQNNTQGLVLAVLDSCPSQVWSLLLMFIIARIVSVGSKYVTNAANFFLITVGLSILSIMIGTVLFAFGVYDGSLSEDEHAFNDNLYPNYRPDPKTGVTPTFWGLVAIFYPATTGIMAGTNRSKGLKTPNKSIPIGTIGAIFVTLILYICQVWLLGSVVSNEILIYNKLVLTTIAFPSRLVAKMGMVTSCIGAALQCMAGAPQLLGAIAADDAIPFLKFLTRKKRRKGDPPFNPKGQGSLLGLAALGQSTSIDAGDGNVSVASESSADIEYQNSKRAVWFTWAIASLGTLLGNIDRITPILTMFYLMMYGGINLCCFLLAWVDSPGFRPQFKYFSKKTALLGFIWCLVLSFLISWLMALLAMLLLFAIFKYINISTQRTARSNAGNTKTGTNWGDVVDSVKYKITTAVLANVTGTENFHAKNWRPQLLTFVDTNDAGVPLTPEVLALAAQFRGGRGLNIVVSIKHGSYLRKGTFEISQHCSKNLKQYMEKERLQGFCEVILTLSNYEEAVWSAVMHSGLGPVSPNTVLMSWMSDWRRRVKNSGEESLLDESCLPSEIDNIHACSASEFVDTLKGLGNMQRAVCILKGRKFPRNGDIMPVGSTIDIYWVVDDGGLCLLLSYIISRNTIWRSNANLQLFAVTTTEEDNHPVLKLAVVEFLQQIRINATVCIVSMKKTDLANDFRASACSFSPSGAPTLTVGEKFRMLKDDAISTSSSVSAAQAQGFQSFLPLGDTACLPLTNVKGAVDSPHQVVAPLHQKKYFEFPENDVNDSSQQHLEIETAQEFNNLIRRNSPSASLVVTHLPIPHKVSKASEFMEYVDTMFKDVDNMLLIQGTGVEYLTTVA